MSYICRAKTKKEAEEKAKRYIKPGHRRIRKVKGGYEVYVSDKYKKGS